jgi:hypothetical protein
MRENLVQYTDEELITRYLISNANAQIEELQQTKYNAQERCEHRHVNIEHKRVDDYGASPEFYSNMRCLICSKHWTEKGRR